MAILFYMKQAYYLMNDGFLNGFDIAKIYPVFVVSLMCQIFIFIIANRLLLNSQTNSCYT
ncbi:hypothetical protein SAMN05428947_101805 [Mucilaginibacter sp. OK283]|jgi:hypothetical protein|nr:hypothetical protein SAMN05428947_101805 [Mucilaginibacter sp. OK283]